MLGFVSSEELSSLARELVAGFADQLARHAGRPRARSGKGGMAMEGDKVEKSLAGLFDATRQACRSRRLSFLGRARLARAIQAELKARGYSSELVSQVTSAVTINALVAPGKNPPP